MSDWREVLKRSGNTEQAPLERFGIELPARKHNHNSDIIYERNGVLPPCKRKPGDPYYEVSE